MIIYRKATTSAEARLRLGEAIDWLQVQDDISGKLTFDIGNVAAADGMGTIVYARHGFLFLNDERRLALILNGLMPGRI